MKSCSLLSRTEDGIFVATCPAPRMHFEGKRRAEAQANIREAIAGYRKSLRKHGEPVPPGIEEEVVEIALG
jgi:antitoxin HicB